MNKFFWWRIGLTGVIGWETAKLIKAEGCEKDIMREREREREGDCWRGRSGGFVHDTSDERVRDLKLNCDISVGFDRVWKRGALCEELKMFSLSCRRRVGCVVFGFHVNIYLNCYSNGTIFICANVMFLIFFFKYKFWMKERVHTCDHGLFAHLNPTLVYYYLNS